MGEAQLGAQTDDPAVLALLFTELNRHLRSSDEKRVTLFVGYIGLLTLAVSIMATRNVPDPLTGDATWQQLVAYGVLILVSCVVIFILDAYRGAKQEYKLLCERITHRLGVDDRYLPDWLRGELFRPPRLIRVAADNALTYFVVVTASLLMVGFNLMLRHLQTSGRGTALIATNAVCYVLYLAVLRYRVHLRRDDFRAQEAWEKRRRAEEDWTEYESRPQTSGASV
jgi:branched-subunit amino acid ABC-type transport system permease component